MALQCFFYAITQIKMLHDLSEPGNLYENKDFMYDEN